MTAPPPPLPFRLAIVAIVIETLLAWGYVAYLIYASASAAGSWRVIGYFALYAVAFAGLTWALVVRKRWVRAPLIVLQLFLIAVGLGFVQADGVVIGLVMAALAVGCIVLLLMPSTRAVLGAR